MMDRGNYLCASLALLGCLAVWHLEYTESQHHAEVMALLSPEEIPVKETTGLLDEIVTCHEVGSPASLDRSLVWHLQCSTGAEYYVQRSDKP